MGIRIVVLGAGAMGVGILKVLQKFPEFEIVAVADKNPSALERAKSILPPKTIVASNFDNVLETRPEVVIDATTSILESALSLIRVLEEKTSVILMNGEVDQVFGRLLARIARKNDVVLTSDAGDQHGVLSRLIADVKGMGFQLIMAGNNKGFLDRYATPDSIVHEAAIRRLTLEQCCAYTDGTKMAIEMAIIGNAENLTVMETGMVGPRVDEVPQALKVFNLDKARELGGVADYVLGAKPGGSVFAVGYSNNEEDRFYMNYYKMGKGPYYCFLRPYHLCHFETPLAIRSVMTQKQPILTQKKYNLEVNSYAKKDLKSGTKLDGIGGYCVYGLLDKPSATTLPIGLASEAVLTTEKKKNEPIKWDDVEFPDGDRLLNLWKEQGS
jgi:predicted homoserine dehydrogenase-like protein